jgi:hypothetical protein
MDNRKKLFIFWDIYILCVLLTLLIFFIVYCCQDREFLLHLVGIIFTLPAVTYCIIKLRHDLKVNRP